jgi:hypothetical protein
VAPKQQTDGGPLHSENDSGRTRKVVILPSAALQAATAVAPTDRSAPQTPPLVARRDPRTTPDPAMAQWLGELRGDEAPLAGGNRSGDFVIGEAPVAATVVPVRGRDARQSRKAEEKARKAEEQVRKVEEKARKAEEKARKAEQKAAGSSRRSRPEAGRAIEPAPYVDDASRHPDIADLDNYERGRLLSVLVFWAPALILLLLAGVVIWLVR